VIAPPKIEKRNPKIEKTKNGLDTRDILPGWGTAMLRLYTTGETYWPI